MTEPSAPSLSSSGPVGFPGGRGLLVTLDGPSGVGKTTVSALLADLLVEAGPVLLTAEPSDSPLGRLARHGTFEFRGFALSLLVAADRYHHSASVIVPAVEAGAVVVCDRYMPSALVLDRLDGVEAAFVAEVYRYLPPPDLAVFLADAPEANRIRAERRGGHTRFHRTDPAAAAAEAEMFDEVAAGLSGQGYPVATVRIDGRPAPRVAEQIAQMVAARRTASPAGR